MPDFSCYITLTNNLDVPLVYVNKGTTDGYWEVDPPDVIAEGTTSPQFQIKDDFGFYGSAGFVVYRIELRDVPNQDDMPLITVNFDDPTGENDNTFSMQPSNAFALFKLSNTPFPKRDHPLTVTGSLDFDYAISTGSRAESVVLEQPVLNVVNSQLEIHNEANLEIWNDQDPAEFDDPSTENVAGSFYPVSIDIIQDTNLVVRFKIDEALLSVPFYVRADLGDQTILRNEHVQYCNDPAGYLVAQMAIHPTWASVSFPWGFAGDCIWHLTVAATQQDIETNTSRLEIYALPNSLPWFYEEKIAVTFLRTVILPARDSTNQDFIDWTIQTCFANYGFKYNTFDGKSEFTQAVTGGRFQLQDWVNMANHGGLISCFDQSGIVQIIIGLNPNSQTSAWYYMDPYGYIPTCYLVGVGDCNNPFFTSNGTPQICDNNLRERTAFDLHTFISVPTVESDIADATCGPHLANESLQDFIAASIEPLGDGPNETYLYAIYPDKGPGTIQNATPTTGIGSLNIGPTDMILPVGSIKSSKIAHQAAETAISRAIVKNPVTGNPGLVNLDIPELNHTLSTRPGFQVIDKAQNISSSHAVLKWVLGSDALLTKVVISVHFDANGAVRALQDHLLTYERLVDKIFEAADIVAYGTHCLVFESRGSPFSSVLWIHGNLFAYVTGPSKLVDLDKQFVKPLDEHFSSHETHDGVGGLLKPQIDGISAPHKIVKGRTFVARASVSGANTSAVKCGRNEKIILISAKQELGEFRFRARALGKETVILAFAHPVSGQVASQQFEVEVVEDV